MTLSLRNLIRSGCLHGLFIAALCVPVNSQAGISINISSGFHYGGHYRHGYSYGHRRYRRNYYGYRHQGYGHLGYSRYYAPRYHYPQRYPSHRVYSAPQVYSAPTTTTVYTENTVPQVQSTLSIDDRAWDLLIQGDEQGALNLFSEQARRQPLAGIPKAGVALASASAGDLNTGIWAMRRAMRLDPKSLHYLALDPEREQVLDNLIERYSQSRRAGAEHQDNAFMIAALHYLRHNYPSAETAIALATGQGDLSTSTTNLVHLLSQQTNNAGSLNTNELVELSP